MKGYNLLLVRCLRHLVAGIDSRLHHLRNDTDEAINTKLAHFLSGRGFSHATIKTVLKQLSEEQTT